jgi:hypothetical protein
VANSLSCDIGRNWAEEVSIPVGASVSDVEEILKKFKE